MMDCLVSWTQATVLFLLSSSYLSKFLCLNIEKKKGVPPFFSCFTPCGHENDARLLERKICWNDLEQISTTWTTHFCFDDILEFCCDEDEGREHSDCFDETRNSFQILCRFQII